MQEVECTVFMTSIEPKKKSSQANKSNSLHIHTLRSVINQTTPANKRQNTTKNQDFNKFITRRSKMANLKRNRASWVNENRNNQSINQGQ